MGETGVSRGPVVSLWEVEWVFWLRGAADIVSVLFPWNTPGYHMKLYG